MRQVSEIVHPQFFGQTAGFAPAFLRLTALAERCCESRHRADNGRQGTEYPVQIACISRATRRRGVQGSERPEDRREKSAPHKYPLVEVKLILVILRLLAEL